MKQYSIGDWVLVTAISGMQYNSDDRTRHLEDFDFVSPMPGQVLGLTTKQEGIYEPGYRGLNLYDYDDVYPAKLIITKAISLWQVRFALRGRIFLVRPENLYLCDSSELFELPYSYDATRHLEGWNDVQPTQKAITHGLAETSGSYPQRGASQVRRKKDSPQLG